MPYPSNDNLPPSVRNHLPPHAQDIYREAFNHAWVTYARSARREQIAHRTCVSAWNKDPVLGVIGVQSGPPH
jgi:cation transport regulator